MHLGKTTKTNSAFRFPLCLPFVPFVLNLMQGLETRIPEKVSRKAREAGTQRTQRRTDHQPKMPSNDTKNRTLYTKILTLYTEIRTLYTEIRTMIFANYCKHATSSNQVFKNHYAPGTHKHFPILDLGLWTWNLGLPDHASEISLNARRTSSFCINQYQFFPLRRFSALTSEMPRSIPST